MLKKFKHIGKTSFHEIVLFGENDLRRLKSTMTNVSVALLFYCIYFDKI